MSSGSPGVTTGGGAYDWSRVGAPASEPIKAESGITSFAKKHGGSIGLGLEIGGAAGQTLGAFYQSKANKANLQAQSALNRLAAEQESQRAVDVAHARGEEAFKMRLKQNQLEGTQRAQIAAAGGDVAQGSAAAIVGDTKYIGDLDMKALKDDTQREVYALLQRSRAKAMDANMLALRAKAERPGLSALTQLITGATRVSGRWYSTTVGVRG